MLSLIPLHFDVTTDWVFLVWALYDLFFSKNKSLQTSGTIAVDGSALLQLYRKHKPIPFPLTLLSMVIAKLCEESNKKSLRLLMHFAVKC